MDAAAAPGRRNEADLLVHEAELSVHEAELTAALDRWCRRHLGARIVRALWCGGHLSVVRAVHLDDGRDVVLKARPDPGNRLRGVTAVQRHLARAGFPCPAPLAGPTPLAGPSVGRDLSAEPGPSVGHELSVEPGLSVGHGLSVEPDPLVGHKLSVEPGPSVGHGLSVGHELSIGHGPVVVPGLPVEPRVPIRLGLFVTAETHLPGGAVPAPGPVGTERAAATLADLHRLAPAPDTVPHLGVPPPWSWPDPVRLWPVPDDRDADLNARPGPVWLDELACRVRQFLLAQDGPRIIGHTDFEAQNLRVRADGQLRAVHDWDSVAVLPEAVLAGLAAAVHTADGSPGTEADIASTAAFLDAYARHRPLGADGVRLAWAAGLWVRAFNARKDHDGDPGAPSLARLRGEAPERLHRAGLPYA